jgi:hypothetical protein
VCGCFSIDGNKQIQQTLEWILNHIDAGKCLINNVDGKCVGVFLSMEINKYDKLREPEVKLNTNFVVYFYEKHNTGKLLASLWKEDRKFINRAMGLYSTINLYIFLMALICRLYGEKDRFFNGFNMPINSKHTLTRATQ